MKSLKSKVRKIVYKPCKEGQQRNPNTNRCVYIKKSPVKKKTPKSKKLKKLIDKQCKEGQEINPKTNRCIKKRSMKKKSKKLSPKQNYFSAPLRRTSPLLTNNKRFSEPEFYLPAKQKKSIKKVKNVKTIIDKKCKEGQEINPKTNRCVKIIVKKSPKKKKSNLKKSSNNKSMNDDDDDDEDDNDEQAEEYLNHFLDLVDELPFITYKEDIENGDEPYTKDMLIEDIINIISDIHKETNFIVVPDPETMIDIATSKFDNGNKKHNKEVNEFIFGTKRGNDGVFDKIRNLTRQVEKQKENLMENRYHNVDDENDILF
jgi:hypothetical protein